MKNINSMEKQESRVIIHPVMCKKIGWDESEIQYFNSARQAAKATGVAQQSISLVCLGRLRSAGGYLWRYSDRPAEPIDYSNRAKRGKGKKAKASEPSAEGVTSAPMCAEVCEPAPAPVPEKRHKTNCMPDPFAYMKRGQND